MNRRLSSLEGLPVVLVVLDGWGVSSQIRGNAIAQTKPKHYRSFLRDYPHTLLQASGSAVGLLPGQDGNSEAGHQNIGAGRIVQQDVLRINAAIADGTFFKNSAFIEAIQHVHKHRSQLHLMGLLTNSQSAHASPGHLLALLQLTRQRNVPRVVLHLFTDGRDTSPHAATRYLRKLQKFLEPHERIATIMGRYYAMERSKQWEVTEQAYHALVDGVRYCAETPEEAVIQAYNRKETDEFIQPTGIGSQEDIHQTRIRQKDSVIFFNQRSDRARQLTKAFVRRKFQQKNPGAFRRKVTFHDLKFVAMTDFGPDLSFVLTAFPSIDVKQTLPMMLRPFRQHYIAESQKYAHMTFFINGGYSAPVAGEDRTLIPSPAVKSYDRVPQMSLKSIQNIVVKNLKEKRYDFIALNVANSDMVAHTGNFLAAKRAIETTDAFLGTLARAVIARQGTLLITADHGNVEEMINIKTGEVDTEHSNAPVPLIVVSRARHHRRLRRGGKLADIAPTILDLFHVAPPKAMTGRSLFLR